MALPVAGVLPIQESAGRERRHIGVLCAAGTHVRSGDGDALLAAAGKLSTGETAETFQIPDFHDHFIPIPRSPFPGYPLHGRRQKSKKINGIPEQFGMLP